MPIASLASRAYPIASDPLVVAVTSNGIVFDARGAHITGCRVTQQAFGGGGITARAIVGIDCSCGRAICAAGSTEQRPTKNAVTTMQISAPPAP
jgi:hypothetical protein